MKFYPSDWRADPALRSCTIAARGLWIEMLALMHEAEPYGSLLINGARIDKKRLAALAGIKDSECTVLLLELEGFGVFSRDDDGTIYSRRMRRDAQKAAIDRTNGKLGGNPKVKVGVNPQVNGGLKAQKPEARSHTEDRMGDAPEAASKFTEGSKALTSAFWKALGFESPLAVPPEYAGIDWRAIEWERAGWTVDLIDAEIRRQGPGKPTNYYEKCFATSFAKRQAPLPVVEIREAEQLTVTNHARPKNGIIQAADDIRRKLASFDGPARGVEQLRSGEGKPPPRLLSNG